MAGSSLHCETCGKPVTVEEKDPPGQLILLCNHTTELYSLDEYSASNLPTAGDRPDAWVSE
ncbi:hypothetical protein ACFQH6_12475 [Halobacteriaceae archaeon GCM10025711]